ncbi:hypothetical protein SNEBB_007317 [Seison nebaliae]|nr:hypothetical protein SNEBB_007317 [Seison nebaliae]
MQIQPIHNEREQLTSAYRRIRKINITSLLFLITLLIIAFVVGGILIDNKVDEAKDQQFAATSTTTTTAADNGTTHDHEDEATTITTTIEVHEDEDDHDHEDEATTTTATTTTTTEPSTSAKWGYGFLSVTIVSLSSIIGVFIIPCVSARSLKTITTTFIGLAVGTLMGDTFYHIIPYVLSLHGHDDDHDHGEEAGYVKVLEWDFLWKMSVILLGFFGFYLIELILRIISYTPKTSDYSEIFNTGEVSLNDDDGHDHSSGIAPTAWMILLGDGMHNIADGLALGVAFSARTTLGWSTTVAVLLHEIPHELGDYSILIQSGFSVRKAVFFNLLSAATAYIGLIVALAISDNIDDARLWIFAVTAGNFLYVSLTDLLPTLLNRVQRTVYIIFQVMGIVVGILLMLLLSIYEDDLLELFD